MDVLGTLRSLEGQLSQEERRDRLAAIVSFLEEDAEVVEAYLRHFYASSIASLLPSFVYDEAGPFFEIEVNKYYPSEESSPRLCLLFAYLQEHTSHDAALDDAILKKLVALTESTGLDSLVDDICVNFSQWTKVRS